MNTEDLSGITNNDNGDSLWIRKQIQLEGCTPLHCIAFIHIASKSQHTTQSSEQVARHRADKATTSAP